MPAVCDANVTDSEIRLLNKADNADTVIALSTRALVREPKTLIVPIAKARMYRILSKNGFTKGTPEEFVKFLHGRGI